MSETNGVVDWDEAFESVGGDESLLKEVIEAFQTEVPTLFQNMDQAIADGNAKDLQRAGHTMKGSLRYFGATEASDLAHQLEELGRKGSFENAKETATKLRQAVEQVSEELKHIPQK